MVSNRNFLFQGSIFRCHVSFWGVCFFFTYKQRLYLHHYAHKLSSSLKCSFPKFVRLFLNTETKGSNQSPTCSGTVPKMEVLHLIKLFLGVGFPLHKPYPYCLYRWRFLHFRYLKCLVNKSSFHSRIVSFSSNPILESLKDKQQSKLSSNKKTQALKTSNQFPKILTRKTKQTKNNRSTTPIQVFSCFFGLDTSPTTFQTTPVFRFGIRPGTGVEVTVEVEVVAEARLSGGASKNGGENAWKLKGRIFHGDSNLWLSYIAFLFSIFVWF